MKKFLPVIFILLIGTAAKVTAQITSCTQTLRLARSTYDQGRLHELPTLMTDCFSKGEAGGGFTKAERVEAYRLLILAQIYLEEPEAADKAMLELLTTDPYFKPNPELDPAEFIALYNTFRTEPIYRLGLNLSLNSTQQNVTNFNPVSEGSSTNQHKIGYGGGVTFEIPLLKHLTLNPGLNFSLKKFGSTSTASQISNGVQTEYSSTISLESQSWICLPVVVQYQLKERATRFSPYVLAGFSVDYLLSAKSTLTEKRTGVQSIEPSTIDFKPQREKTNLSALAGAGIRTRIAGGFLVCEARFLYGLTNINSQSTLLANQNTLINYKFSDGIFKLNSVLLSVGYVQNFFNPKKKIRK